MKKGGAWVRKWTERMMRTRRTRFIRNVRTFRCVRRVRSVRLVRYPLNPQTHGDIKQALDSLIRHLII